MMQVVKKRSNRLDSSYFMKERHNEGTKKIFPRKSLENELNAILAYTYE